MNGKNEQLNPKIYVACLASYNAGILHGEWIDADQEPEELQEKINKMLSASPVEDAEEFAIHDYDDFYVYLSEYPGLETVSNIANFLVEHGKLGAEILSHCCNDLEEAKRAMEEQYLGEYESLEDYAYDYIDQTMNLPEFVKTYFDYKAFARDIDLNGDVFVIEMSYNQVHVFSSY